MAVSERFSFYVVFLLEQITLQATYEVRMFSQKQNKKYYSKTQLDEKNLPFHDVLYHLVFLYFSTAGQVAFALHNKKQ